MFQKKRLFIKNIFIYLFLCFHFHLFTQEQTVGLFLNTEQAFEGYTLFAPLSYTTTYLIDNEGRLVHSWKSQYQPGNAVYLLEDGTLLRTARFSDDPEFDSGGVGGLIQKIDWYGKVLWEYQYASDSVYQHHDVEMLPNGNILIIAWEYKSPEQALKAGRQPHLLSEDGLWPDHIIEVQSHESTGGHIVWEWHVWDHLIQNADPAKPNFGKVVDHPELIDINYSQIDIPDWNHTNGIDYHADLDQIILSVREFCEFWIIDHSTTTEEAAGHMGGRYGKGGDILYRWGNPNSYKTGIREEQRLFYQHDAQWIRDELVGGGHILVFNNGVGRPKGEYSSVDEIVPPVDQDSNYNHITDFPYGPLEPIWIYSSPVPTDFYSSYISGAQRFPNGNTLICSGETGTFLEVTQDKELVWKYVNPVVGSGPIAQGDTIPEKENQPVNHVFRAYRYGPDYSGLAGHDLNPGDPIELYQDQVSNRQLLEPDRFGVSNNYPNPFNGNTNIIFEFPSKTKVKLMITDLLGNQLKMFNLGSSIGGRYAIQWDGKDFQDHPVNSGIYFCRLQFDNHFMTRKMVIIK